MTEPLVYETAPIGETVGPIRYTIPLDYNRRRLAAYSLPESAFLPGRGLAEPSLLCGQHSWVMRQRFSWGGSVHAKCDIAFLRPIALGASIHVSCRLSGKYERRGGRYVVFTLESRDDAGDLVCQVDNAMLLNFREVIAARRGARGAAKSNSAAAVHADASPALQLSFGPKILDREDILDFFAAEEAVYGPHPSLHNRQEIAQAAGLSDIIAPGRYSIGLMNCMFARLYRGKLALGHAVFRDVSAEPAAWFVLAGTGKGRGRWRRTPLRHRQHGPADEPARPVGHRIPAGRVSVVMPALPSHRPNRHCERGDAISWRVRTSLAGECFAALAMAPLAMTDETPLAMTGESAHRPSGSEH